MFLDNKVGQVLLGKVADIAVDSMGLTLGSKVLAVPQGKEWKPQ